MHRILLAALLIAGLPVLANASVAANPTSTPGAAVASPSHAPSGHRDGSHAKHHHHAKAPAKHAHHGSRHGHGGKHAGAGAGGSTSHT